MTTTSKALFGSLAFAAAAALGPAIASAAPFCPTNMSLFGTVERVNGNVLTVRTPSGHWADVAIDSGARVNTNGNAIRTGVYAGAYGCVSPGGVFHANELTLSNTANGYDERIGGVVRSVRNGTLTVAETSGQYGRWYVPDAADYRAGQSVTGIGMRAANGAFYPRFVDGRSVSYDADAAAAAPAGRPITLSGTIQRVGADTLLVWEPSSRHSAKWVVPNAGRRFHRGERVSATGREAHGTFYVQGITIL